MMKLKAVTFLIVSMAATAIPSFAGASGCCGSAISVSKTEVSCYDPVKLKLTEEQKTKLAALQAKCEENGCNEASREEFLKDAAAILSSEQLADLKASCEVASGPEVPRS